MATRARIGIQQKNRIIASYQHWDGYPGGLGYNLEEHWTDAKKVTEAIKLGNASKWGQIIGEKIDFDGRDNPLYEVQNVYYGRDRGEQDQGYHVYKDEADYLDRGFNCGEEYVYLLKIDTDKKHYLGRPRGEWFYAKSTYTDEGKEVIGGFEPLEKDAINDHIDMLKRHLQNMEKEAA